MQEKIIIPKSAGNILKKHMTLTSNGTLVGIFYKPVLLKSIYKYIRLKVSNYFETVHLLCIITENISV
jgi:hypothetical protein